LTYIRTKANSIFTPQINHIESGIGIEKVDTCISSGMFISKEIYQRIRKFEEKLFVECVDMDYRLRARVFNFEILRIKDNSLSIQQFGKTTHSRFLDYYTQNDSPERTYYIAKYHILLKRKYRKQLNRYEIKRWIWDYIFARLIEISLVEDKKIKKTYSIVKACFDSLYSAIY
jgi:GT2 family glycosyltransferase